MVDVLEYVGDREPKAVRTMPRDERARLRDTNPTLDALPPALALARGAALEGPCLGDAPFEAPAPVEGVPAAVEGLHGRGRPVVIP